MPLFSPETPQSILSKLRSVDGTGSGLDADTVDGYHAADLQGGGGASDHGDLTGLADDDHTQYLLVGGTRNGKATIVAETSVDTPLTLKVVANQTGDSLSIKNESDNPMLRVNNKGFIRVGSNVTSESPQFVSPVLVDHTVTNFTVHQQGLNVTTRLNDTSTTAYSGYDHSAIGVNLNIDSANTNTPFLLYGLNSSVINYSNRPVSTYGAYSYLEDYADDPTPFIVGMRTYLYKEGGRIDSWRGCDVMVESYGTEITYGCNFLARRPYADTFGTFASVDIEDVSGLNATNKFAIRVQGGNTELNAGASTIIPLTIKGAASQSANLIDAQNNSSVTQFAVGSDGKLKTNQAVSNTHTPSGATSKAMPIYDASGNLLGYIPVYASQW